MIYYIALEPNGRKVLCGTQAEAKVIDKDFTQIDLPTDKAGLMATYQEALDTIHSMTTKASEPDTSDIPEASEEFFKRAKLSYAHQQVAFEDEFARMSLTKQLHFAALAMENARDRFAKEAPEEDS